MNWEKLSKLLKKLKKIEIPETSLVIDVINGFEKLKLKEHLEHYRGIPLYESGRLAAKIGGYSFNDHEKPDSTVVVYQPELHGRAKQDLRALRVGGDSMWPMIPEGSIVVVDLNDKEFVENKISSPGTIIRPTDRDRQTHP